MIKKILFTLLLCLTLVIPVSTQSWTYGEACIASDIATIASLGTATDGSEFTAVPIKIQRLDGSSIVGLTVQFTAGATASGDDLVFSWVGSWDNGTTYTTSPVLTVSVASDVTTVAVACYHLEQKVAAGISHLKLSTVYNGDSVAAITVVNAYVSGGK